VSDLDEDNNLLKETQGKK